MAIRGHQGPSDAIKEEEEEEEALMAMVGYVAHATAMSSDGAVQSVGPSAAAVSSATEEMGAISGHQSSATEEVEDLDEAEGGAIKAALASRFDGAAIEAVDAVDAVETAIETEASEDVAEAASEVQKASNMPAAELRRTETPTTEAAAMVAPRSAMEGAVSKAAEQDRPAATATTVWPTKGGALGAAVAGVVESVVEMEPSAAAREEELPATLPAGSCNAPSGAGAEETDEQGALVPTAVVGSLCTPLHASTASPSTGEGEGRHVLGAVPDAGEAPPLLERTAISSAHAAGQAGPIESAVDAVTRSAVIVEQQEARAEVAEGLATARAQGTTQASMIVERAATTIEERHASLTSIDLPAAPPSAETGREQPMPSPMPSLAVVAASTNEKQAALAVGHEPFTAEDEAPRPTEPEPSLSMTGGPLAIDDVDPPSAARDWLLNQMKVAADHDASPSSSRASSAHSPHFQASNES